MSFFLREIERNRNGNGNGNGNRYIDDEIINILNPIIEQYNSRLNYHETNTNTNSDSNNNTNMNTNSTSRSNTGSNSNSNHQNENNFRHLEHLEYLQFINSIRDVIIGYNENINYYLHIVNDITSRFMENNRQSNQQYRSHYTNSVQTMYPSSYPATTRVLRTSNNINNINNNRNRLPINVRTTTNISNPSLFHNLINQYQPTEQQRTRQNQTMNNRALFRRIHTLMTEDVVIPPTEQQIQNATRMITYNILTDDDNENTDNTCPITLESFEDGEQVCQIIHCGHYFSEHAIRNWFLRHTRCPVCRYDIRNHTDSSNNILDYPSNEIDTEIDTEMDTETNNIIDELVNAISNNYTNIIDDIRMTNTSITRDSSYNYMYTFEIPISIFDISMRLL
jgi:hypothetical protein